VKISEAARNLASLVNRVYEERISIDLERDEKVIARLTPAEPHSPLMVAELGLFLRSLPALGDDVENYANDVRAIRAEFPAEANPWD
jgi:hypothetical protein